MRRNSSTLFGYSIYHPINLILFFNIFIFILQNINDAAMTYQFGLIPFQVLNGKFWQLFTYGFLHAVGLLPLHILFNMYGFYMLGSILDKAIGKWKLVGLYFASQLGGGIIVFAFGILNTFYFENKISLMGYANIPTIGASGGVFGLLAVFGLLFPEMVIVLLVIPIKAKNAVWISLALGIGLSIFGESNLSHICHLGGALSGYAFYYLILEPRRRSGKFTLPKIFEQKRYDSPNKEAKTQETKIEDFFEVQIKANEKLLKQIESSPKKDIPNILNPIQVADANICPAIAYNPEDSTCLRCEWLPNCALRKHNSK